MNVEDQRLMLAGQILQGLLERDTKWSSKILDDVFYERLAKHTVKIVDAVIKERRVNYDGLVFWNLVDRIFDFLYWLSLDLFQEE